MTFYDDMQSVTSTLLTEFSQGALQYVDTTPGNGPPDDPGAATETVYPLAAVARGVQFKYVQGGLAIASDLQTTIAATLAIVPNVKGFIIMDGQRFKIVQVEKIPAAGTPVAYVAIFRR